MILDTSALLAYFDANEPRHADVAAFIEAHVGPLVISPYVIAELDYLLLTRHGAPAEQRVLTELAGGAWELASIDLHRLDRARELTNRYPGADVGITDASLVILAEDYGTRTIATLDRRHFSILRFADGTAPLIVP